jgi:fluoride exporter
MLAVIFLCTGASLGAIARWQLSLWLNTGGTVPLGTLAANLAGAWLIGFAIALFDGHPGVDPVWRLAAITGFLGALTTFSTFSAEAVALLQAGRFGAALALSSLHLLGSLALTAIGLRCGRWWLA